MTLGAVRTALLLLFLIWPAACDSDKKVSFPDPGLERAVRAAIKKPSMAYQGPFMPLPLKWSYADVVESEIQARNVPGSSAFSASWPHR